MNKIINLFFKEWFNLISETVSESDFQDTLYNPTNGFNSAVKGFAKSILLHDEKIKTFNANPSNSEKKPNFMDEIERPYIELFIKNGIDLFEEPLENNDITLLGIAEMIRGFSEALTNIEKYDTLKKFLTTKFGKIKSGSRSVTAQNLPNVIAKKTISKGAEAASNTSDKVKHNLRTVFSGETDVAARSEKSTDNQMLANTISNKVIEQSKICFKALADGTARKITNFSEDSLFEKTGRQATKYMQYSYINYFAKYIEDMLESDPNKFEQIISNAYENGKVKSDAKIKKKQEVENEKAVASGKNIIIPQRTLMQNASIEGIVKALANKHVFESEKGPNFFEDYCKNKVLENEKLLKAIAIRCVIGLTSDSCSLSPKYALCMLPTYMIDELNVRLNFNIDNPCLASKEEEEGEATKNNKPCYRTLAITGNNDAGKNNNLMEKFFNERFPSLETHTKYTTVLNTWIFGKIISSLGGKGKSCADDQNSWEIPFNNPRNYKIENTQESFWNNYINNILNEIQYDLS